MRSGWVLVALVAAAAAVADVRADGVWTDRTIDSVRQFSLGGSALHIDPGGHPHVFVGGDRVYHDWFDGSAWQREIVDPKARSGDSLQSAIGPSGDLHVVYQRSTPGGANPMAPALVSQPPTSQLFYATNLSGAWVVQQIPTPSQSAAPGIVSGLVVDANHAPHFLIGVPGVFHETLQNGTWSWEPVADVTNYASSQTKGSDQPPQLAIDASGDLHAILYLATSGPNPRLDYAKRDATGWHNEVLDSVNGTPIQVATSEILLDATGNPHILTGAQHLSHSGGAWSVEAIPVAPWFFGAQFDAGNQLHMLALIPSGPTGFSSTELDSLTRGNAGWTDEGSLASFPTPAHVSLGVAASGVQAVVLADATDSRPLTYLQRGDTWTSSEIDRTGSITAPDDTSQVNPASSCGADVRMVLANGQRRLLYRCGKRNSDGAQAEGGFVRHALEQGDDFTIENVPLLRPDCPSVIPDTLALALDGEGSERAAWMCSYVVESTRAVGGTWSTFSPSRESMGTGFRPAVAFDAGGQFQSLFAQPTTTPTTDNLRHAVDTTTRLSAETIAQVPSSQPDDLPGKLAIAPGPLGSAVAAYLDQFGRVVEATNASGAWVSSIVGTHLSESTVASYALLVEAGGTVHMAYEDGTVQHRLVYGTNRCGGWYETVIDPLSVSTGNPFEPTVYGSRNPELALDSVGNPHISYRRQADQSLGYAHVQGGVWTTETVASDTTSGENSAIAVDDSGVVSIAHHDVWGGNLHLATRQPLDPEPAWDGCPPLPDPNTLQQGTFVFEPPADALPLYDPTGYSIDGSVGDLSLTYSVTAEGGRRLSPFATTLGIGKTGLFGSDNVASIGKVSAKRGQVQVLDGFLIEANSPNEPRIRAIVARTESIDVATHARSVAEILQGRIDGKKVTATTSFDDQVAPDAFGLHLILQIAPTRKRNTLAVGGYLILKGGPVQLFGKGQWNPMTATADVQLSGGGARLTLRHLHVWKSRADGVHLSAGQVVVSALGQKFATDLTGAF